MKTLNNTPLLLIIIFVGIATLALSPLGFYSQFSYQMEINNTTGNPVLDNVGNPVYTLTNEQETAKEFYDYENKVIQDFGIQTTIFWVFMIIVIVIAVFLAIKPFIIPNRRSRKKR